MNCTSAGAKIVVIELHRDSDKIRFSIKDDGVGFDLLKLRERGQSHGLGLMSMQERAEAIGGSCRIESAPCTGTRIVVEVNNPDTI